MKLWIGHYHLEPGGVTRIIQSQVTSVGTGSLFEEVCVISGTDSAVPLDGRVVSDPMINYMDTGQPAQWYRDTADRIFDWLTGHVGSNDILHFHNPNLGKNPALTYALAEMAQRGYRLMLHCHDFAEDRRENIEFLRLVVSGHLEADLRKTMYPTTDRSRYGVLNSHDLGRMRR